MARQVLLQDGDVQVFCYADTHVYVQKGEREAAPLHVGALNIHPLLAAARAGSNGVWRELLARASALRGMPRDEVREFLAAIHVPEAVVREYLGD